MTKRKKNCISKFLFDTKAQLIKNSTFMRCIFGVGRRMEKKDKEEKKIEVKTLV